MNLNVGHSGVSFESRLYIGQRNNPRRASSRHIQGEIGFREYNIISSTHEVKALLYNSVVWGEVISSETKFEFRREI